MYNQYLTLTWSRLPMRKFLIPVLVASIVTSIGCGRNNTTNNASNNTSPVEDMGTTADMTPGDDMTPDDDMSETTPSDMGGDMTEGDMGIADTGPCDDISACAENEVCFEGRCRTAQACSSFRQTKSCKSYVERLGGDAAAQDRVFCDGSFCKLACIRDSECSDGMSCTDNGMCVPFLGEITGEHPGGDARAPLKAGVGNALMTFPIGLPLGGYGSRAGNDNERYSDALTSSWGQMHGLYARAILLDNGERQMLFIRMPIIFPTAPLHEKIARELQAKTGKDWRDSLVISGTHTHSGPGRFLHLPPSEQAALPLGAFGTDWFNEQAFDWVAKSALDAADQALTDLSDAKLGWEIVEAFDTDDAISSDRWGATPPFDDNRLLLMRIDDLEDNPRALLFSFGMHGTFNSSDYATGDSMGGIERKLEDRFGEAYDRFVPTMFFNQNGGTMSPRGDQHGHRDNHKMEFIGWKFVDRMWTEIEAIEGGRDISLSGKTLRFPLGYDVLGYEPGEWTSYFPSDDGADLIYGGLQCQVGGAEDNDPATHMEPEDNQCAGISGVLYNRPPSLFLRSQMTALEIDGLTVVTLPGEASMELGWQVLREVQNAHGVDPLDAWVWGYAQDHQFYLTPSNLRGPLPPFPGISTPMAPDDYPDYAFSYYQGGYEAGFTIWGARMGDFLVDRAVEVTGLLLGTTTETEFDQPLPLQYTRRGDPPFEVFATADDKIGTVSLEPPAQVQRLEAIEFAWLGGDPGAEMPQAPLVTLEREVGGNWEPVTHVNTRDYSNRELLMLTRLRRQEGSEDWEWVIYWEELKNFPLGQYRFHVQGHYQNDGGERVPYETTSGAFEVVPNNNALIEVERNDTTISGTLGYPVAERIKNPKTPLDLAAVSGSYRLRHPDVPTGVSDPIEDISTITVRVEDSNGDLIEEFSDAEVTVVTAPEDIDGRQVPVTRYSVTLSQSPAAPVTIKVNVTDNEGNRGEAEVSL